MAYRMGHSTVHINGMSIDDCDSEANDVKEKGEATIRSTKLMIMLRTISRISTSDGHCKLTGLDRTSAPEMVRTL